MPRESPSGRRCVDSGTHARSRSDRHDFLASYADQEYCYVEKGFLRRTPCSWALRVSRVTVRCGLGGEDESKMDAPGRSRPGLSGVNRRSKSAGRRPIPEDPRGIPEVEQLEALRSRRGGLNRKSRVGNSTRTRWPSTTPRRLPKDGRPGALIALKDLASATPWSGF